MQENLYISKSHHPFIYVINVTAFVLFKDYMIFTFVRITGEMINEKHF
jgi:hypothetical protein